MIRNVTNFNVQCICLCEVPLKLTIPLVCLQLSVPSSHWISWLKRRFLTRNAWRGAMIAQGPPSYCSSAIGSSSLNTKPSIMVRKNTWEQEIIHFSFPFPLSSFLTFHTTYCIVHTPLRSFLLHELIFNEYKNWGRWRIRKSNLVTWNSVLKMTVKTKNYKNQQ